MSTSDEQVFAGRLSGERRLLIDQWLKGESQSKNSIPKRKATESLPLSFAQQRLWIIDQLEPGSSAYNIAYTLKLIGPLDRSALVRSFFEIVRRHEVLRTSFPMKEGGPVLLVNEEPSLTIEERDLSSESASAISAYLQAQIAQPFDLALGPLLRIGLIKTGEHEHCVTLSMHHIVTDGWSIGIMIRELCALYSAYSEQHEPALPELSIQYADFAAWQHDWLQGTALERQLSYWRHQLEGGERLELPTDHPRPQGTSHVGARVEIRLGEHLSAEIRGLSRKERATLFMTLLLAFQIVLSRYSGQEDVLVGTAIANRNRSEIEGLIGFFANTLVLRTHINEQLSFAELLRQTRQMTLDAYEHQDVPFEKLVAVLAPERDMQRNPFFQIIFVMQNAPATRLSLSGLRIEDVPMESGGVHLDMTMAVKDVGEDIYAVLEYSASLWEPYFPTQLLHHWKLVLENAVREPHTAITNLHLLSQAEREQFIYGYNQTETSVPSNRCLHELIEAQVEKSPDSIAVTYADKELTYRELNLRANRLANYLRDLGVQPGKPVAIFMERSLELVEGLLAVLKAGGTYVPLDPSYPQERLQLMLSDSAPAAVLTHGTLNHMLETLADVPVVVNLSNDLYLWEDRSAFNPERKGLSVRDGAYVIYTSGSTGTPKGVLNEHQGIVNRLAWMQGTYAIDSRDAVLQKTSMGFDVSVWEFFWPLMAGAKLILARTEGQKDPDYLAAAIQVNQVTVVHFVPSMLQAFLDSPATQECTSLVHVICSGEALPAPIVDRFRALLPTARLHNLYGPTEAAVDVTAWDCPSDGPIRVVPIGTPIWNTSIYILDRHGDPSPVGVPGEIHIGGIAVARGYVNRPELTAERFVPDPFSRKSGGRMYKTGDLGRWLPDGNIDFLGRRDSQIKLRGFRIELGEIEARLLEHPAVKDAAVVATEWSPGDTRIVAYFTTAIPSRVSFPEEVTSSVRTHLANYLPDYMVPSAYIPLDKMPLTASGKLDRKSLPIPNGNAVSTHTFAAPVGEIESEIAAVWAELLRVENVSRTDNFFELGGHSLLAITVAERLKTIGLHVEARALFASRTLADLAAATMPQARQIQVPPNRIPADTKVLTPDMLPLVELAQDEIDIITRSVPSGAQNIQDIYPLMPSQEGILYHHLLSEKGDPYLLYMLGSADEKQRIDSYLAAVQNVIARHDILRTSFVWQGISKPVQVVWRTSTLPVEELHLGGNTTNVRDELLNYCDPVHYKLDVSCAPLMRAFVARDDETHRWYLLLLLHHLVGDQTALENIQEEIGVYLNGQAEALPKVEPFRTLVGSAALSGDRGAAESYFRKLLGDVDEPTAPFGLFDILSDGIAVSEYSVQLDDQFSDRIRDSARKIGVSVAALFHVAWSRLLSAVSGKTNVVFGTVLFGRTDGAIESRRMLGPFMNALPVRIDLEAADVATSIRNMHSQLADLMQHEHTPLTVVQRCSHLLPRVPLFTSLLNYRHNRSGEPGSPAANNDTMLNAIRWEVLKGGTNYPLTLSIDDYGKAFGLEVQTLPSIGAETICSYVETILRSMVDLLTRSPKAPAWRIEVVPEEAHTALISQGAGAESALPTQALHQLFVEQAKATPKAIAVLFDRESITYGDLNRRSDDLARHLMRIGIGNEARVGLYLKRTPWVLISILGVLKAGAAYIPIEPQLAPERVAYMISDAGITCVIVDSQNERDLILSDISTVVIDAMEIGLPGSVQAPAVAELHEVNPQSVAYILYTSGSTGNPKGVMVSHRGLSNYLLHVYKEYFVGEIDKAVVSSPLSFDATVTTLLPALLAGRTVEILRDDDSTLERLAERLFDGDEALLFKITPAHLTALEYLGRPNSFSQASHRIIVGGEQLGAETIRKWKHQLLPNATFVNEYGPTETVVGCCIKVISTVQDVDELASQAAVPIGVPIRNTGLYVLGPFLDLQPMNTVGELFIGGYGVARGYLKRPDLTAERFLPDPFSGRPGARMYKTGDLVKRLPSGDLVFLGRNDDQIKLRGFRIELGEIEQQIKKLEEIEEAAVVARENAAGEKHVVAYIVPTRQPSEEQLEGASAAALNDSCRHQLQKNLPSYMIPSSFMVLRELPLTPHGKIDRKALPVASPGLDALPEYQPPNGEVESIIAKVWCEVLKVDRIGRADNFFDMGGDSLLSIQMIGRLRKLGLLVRPKDVIDHSSLANLGLVAKKISESGGASPDRSEESFGITPTLARIREIDWPIKGYDSFHLIQIPATMKPEVIAAAVQLLLDHHGMLRLRLEIDANKRWTLCVRAPGSVLAKDCVRYVDCSDLDEFARSTVFRDEHARAKSWIDPQAGHIFWCVWFNMGAHAPGILGVLVSHLAIDGPSWQILLTDLKSLCDSLLNGENASLGLEGTTYREWSDILANEAISTKRSGELENWKHALTEDGKLLPSAQIQGDTTEQAGRITVPLSSEVMSPLLTTIPGALRITASDVFLTTLALAARQWKQEQGLEGTSIAVDLNGHGREEGFADVDLSRTIGWFTTLYPVRFDLGDISYASIDNVFRQSAEQIHSAPDNGIGYGLLRYLNQDTAPMLKELGRPQIAFNYVGRSGGRVLNDWELLDPSVFVRPTARDAKPPNAPVQAPRPLEHLLFITAIVRQTEEGPTMDLSLGWAARFLTETQIHDFAGNWVRLLSRLSAVGRDIGVNDNVLRETSLERLFNDTTTSQHLRP